LLAICLLFGEGSAQDRQTFGSLAQPAQPKGKGFLIQWFYWRAFGLNPSPIDEGIVGCYEAILTAIT